VTTSLNNVAQTLQAVGRSAEAEPLYRRLISNLDSGQPGNFWPLGVLHANLAAVVAEAGNSQDALLELHKSISYLRRIGNPDHPFLAVAINNLAFMEQRTGQVAQAETHFREALGIIERSSGRDDPSYATTLMNLAVLARDTNRPAEAEDLTRQVLSTFERTLGPDHPKTISALNSLVILLGGRGAWQSALELSDRASERAIRQIASSGFTPQPGGLSVYGLDDFGFAEAHAGHPARRPE
jgi:tetratricopeptide (TPR) repeat protein